MNETKAIALCLKHRDPAGFSFLVGLFSEQAYRHAFGFLGNAEDAKDACQDAFQKAFAAMPRLERLERFYPWYYSILRNHCFNVLSRKRTAMSKEPAVAFEASVADRSEHPSKALERDEDAESVHETLGRLKPEFREILVLKYFSEYSYEQISETLGISRGTVMSRLYYARHAFKAAIEATESERRKG